MKRHIGLLIAAVAALAFTCQSADAHWRYKKVSKTVTGVAVGAGVASAVTYGSLVHWKWNDVSSATRWGYWGAVTGGCIIISPIVAAALKKSPLTNREVGVLIGSCVVPIVGGWLVNAAYDANPQWEPRVAKSAKRKKAKK